MDFDHHRMDIVSKGGYNELDLVHRLQAGEKKAYEVLYDRYAGAMAGMILKVVPNSADAENVLQDALIKVWRNIHLFDPGKGRLYTFLVTIARRVAIDFTRSVYFSGQKKIQSSDSLVSIADHQDFPSNLDNEQIIKIVQTLEDAHREIIDLLYFRGYTQQEASESLNIPLGTIKSRTRTAINHLRNNLIIKEL